ncbi:glycoside hydrolase family 28 protein [Caulobacter sp. UNC279MFTsu5.1]|uniref:rhamnogalacturonidase n=1 Tax=Caulobacter sp. UNC279MFTsu5.1 TaxID=1502775 RepID=UPI0008EB9CD2|nr:glycosyl hydrolase family 28-related protein [Caulobacter sp. UNC279MFTsu5.1]SFJ98423.1 Polygalacturonase [Caulobacter sp. UNC279MFTsu5.1]
MSRAPLDVRAFGARGDGVSLDTDAINAAIRATHAAGGGEVVLPTGRWLSFSIRLLSGVALRLDEGCVLEAADPARHASAYDPAESNPFDLYQDFGHSHWRNSLIWGDGVEDVAIVGPGLIDGLGLTREGPGSRWSRQAGEFPVSMGGLSPEAMAILVPDREAMAGQGNKAIALKNARRVRLEGFTIWRGGHFAVLATGCDHLAIQGLRIDTNRDGLDLDACRDVVIADCRINTPNDDAIVLKSSLALGEARSTERVEITRCHVSGFDLGTMLDGTLGRTQQLAPDQDRVTGRIKLGTESNGDFRHIAISDCWFTRSRGLALETVDGGTIEDVSIHNIVLREVTTAPLFLRLGDRGRGPDGTRRGAMRRIRVRGLTAFDILPDYAATIAGLEGDPIEDVELTDIRLVYGGGGETAWAERRPGDMAQAYPEPSMFGPTPAHGLWVRHVTGLTLDNVRIETLTPDPRPPILLQAVHGARFGRLGLAWPEGVKPIVGEDVSGLVIDPPLRVGLATVDGDER